MGSKYRLREYGPNQLIHAQVRGFRRRPIFLDDRDQDEWNSRLRRLINATPAAERPKLLASANMRNHQHVFTQNGRAGDATGRVLRSAKIGYAAYFNDRYGQTGPVFESPFKARRVIGGDDIVNVITYVHLNPDFTFRESNSTHGVYAGTVRDAFIDTTLGLHAFGGRDEYLRFIADTERIRRARGDARRRLD